MEDSAVADDQQRQGLRSGRKLRVRRVKVILEGDVLGVEVVGGYIHGGGVKGSARCAGALVHNHYGF